MCVCFDGLGVDVCSVGVKDIVLLGDMKMIFV